MKREFFIIFLISTGFFIVQHAVHFSWDFSAYVLNGRYWFSHGWYFEVLRPPLAPFLLGIFNLVPFGEYIFIIFSSVLFAYSTKKLSNSLGFDETIFYALSMSMSALIYGTFAGTELLSLSFLELFLSYVINDNPLSGIFLGLGFLTRYVAISFSVLLIFHKKIRKILESFGLFLATISPWLIYNEIHFGNPLMSIIDSIALTIYFRGYLFQPINANHFFVEFNILIPFLVYGMYLSFKKFKKTDVMMAIFLLLSVASYARSPVKVARYLFYSIVPTAYYTYVALDRGHVKKAAYVFFAMGFVLASYFMATDYNYSVYKKAFNTLEKMNMTNCWVISNGWVPLNYYGAHSIPYGKEFEGKNYSFVMFEGKNFTIKRGNCYNTREFVMLYSRVNENDYWKIILGDKIYSLIVKRFYQK